MSIIKQFTYQIDANDVMIYVDNNWLDFALENKSSHLTYETVVGTSIWEYITDVDTNQIYQIIFNRVRKDQKSISVPFRCDSPELKRCFYLSIHPLRNNHIEFHSILMHEERRNYQAFLDPTYSRTEEFIKMCSWCKKIYLPDHTWEEVEKAVIALKLFELSHLPQITHGICPTCLDIFLSDEEELPDKSFDRFETYTGFVRN